MNFKQFLEHNPLKIYGSMTANPNGPGNTPGIHNDGNRNGDTGSFVSTDWSGSESGTNKAFSMPGIDILKALDPVVDNCAIESVDGDLPRPNNRPKNPIKITLKNGRRIFMTFDEFKRAGGSNLIRKNKTLQWTLRPNGEFYIVQSVKSL